MFKDMSPQFIAGSKAWADGLDRTANPYSPDKQPAWYGRWDNGWTDCDRLIMEEHYQNQADEIEIQGLTTGVFDYD